MCFLQSVCRMKIAHGSLRLTLSEATTKDDAEFVISELEKIVERLRSMSPLYEDFVKKKKKEKTHSQKYGKERSEVCIAEKVMDHF